MKIGLTQRVLHFNNVDYDCTEHGWYKMLEGHTLVSIANDPEQDFSKLVDSLDMVIVTGGDASPKRLLTEVRLLTECYQKNTAMLGVCHGALFINQMEDGTNFACENHWGTEHMILMEGQQHTVNSFHDNSIVKVAESCDPIALSEEGDVEAFKHKTRPVWGVMWHPERQEQAVLPLAVKAILNQYKT